MLGNTNFMQVMEMETAKRYGFTRTQALLISRREFAEELVQNFDLWRSATSIFGHVGYTPVSAAGLRNFPPPLGYFEYRRRH
jgi:hypothetical protein